MKKQYSILLLLLASTLLLPSCKKFEEDDEWIHLRTVKQRITGPKEIVMFTYGTTDLLPYWHSRFGDFYIYFSKDDPVNMSPNSGMALTVYEKHTHKRLCNGLWGFNGYKDIKDGILFNFTCLDADTSSTFPEQIHGGNGAIIKLSNKEMWLRTTNSDGQQNPHFQEIRFKDYKN